MRIAVFLAFFVVAACSNRTEAPIVPDALAFGIKQTVFVGTTRDVDETGRFGIGRSDRLQFLELDVSVPRDREIGSISNGLKKPNPQKDFVIAAERGFENNADFQRRLRASAGTANEAVVFVHGFNNSYADTSFRIAQLAQDLELPGAMVTYSWPSRGHPLGYEYDSDSALFARDGLQSLLENIRASGVQRIVVIAHSMGSRLVMETMRQLELKSPGWTKKNLSGVILISPDVAVDVFRSQINTINDLPQPFVVFTSQRDVILKLSANLRWEEQRLGNIEDPSIFAEKPITFLDISAFQDRASGNHFAVGNSPALLALLKSPERFDEGFLSGQANALGGIAGQRRIIRNATQIIVSPRDIR